MEDYRQLDIPTLIIKGQGSPRSAALIATKLHRAALRGSLYVVRNGGHMAPITHPHEVASVIADYVLAATAPIGALWAA